MEIQLSNFSKFWWNNKVPSKFLIVYGRLIFSFFLKTFASVWIMQQLHQYNQPLWASWHPHYKEQLYPKGNICISISHAKELYAVYMSKNSRFLCLCINKVTIFWICWLLYIIWQKLTGKICLSHNDATWCITPLDERPGKALASDKRGREWSDCCNKQAVDQPSCVLQK